MTLDVDALAAQQAEHQAAADAAAAAITAHQDEVFERRERLGAEWDHGLLAEYSKRFSELVEQEREARAEFRAAALADPVFAAWAKARSLRWQRHNLQSRAAGAAARTGVAGPADLSYREPRLLQEIVELLDADAQFEAEETATQLDREREDYMSGDQS